ncbi:hypothetical protein [Actinoplanes sp. G11-F43]|uniref:hypothetical protein n=1 Tax=Actinoplanes sp. G11-F43 TaxID=3424130 RepID=UPI003D342DFD
MPIRPATPADAADLAVVHVRTWQAAYAGHVPRDYLDSLEPAQREPGWRRWLTEFRHPAAILWVLESNARARRFYEAAGWVPDGAVKVDSSRGFPMREVRCRRTAIGG